MALEEEEAALEQVHSAFECLRRCAGLAEVDDATLRALADHAVHFSLCAGSLLYEAGQASEGVYLLASGRLSVGTSVAGRRQTQLTGGELVGEVGWLLREPHGASLMAVRDSELLLMPNEAMDRAARGSSAFATAIARLCAGRLRGTSRPERTARARVFVVVPNDDELDLAEFGSQLVAALAACGSAELVWDARASAHTSAWFHRIEELNDFVVYLADPWDSRWTRQCCRQADVILAAAQGNGQPRPWPASVSDAALKRGARVELALLHDGGVRQGDAARWLSTLAVTSHHHLVDAVDFGRMARLLTHGGVGLVLSGGGARGFAHLGVIKALRQARIPIDFVGGTSIGAIIAAGVAMDWDDAEMERRYRRCFVDTNPVNDYTFPLFALTRGRKVSRLLDAEYGEVQIEDLRRPYFCISASLTSGRAYEHRSGRLSHALRASVAIPGVMPPVFHGGEVLVDGAAINNLPVDCMHAHGPGLVIGSDVSAGHSQKALRPLYIYQTLMYAGLVNSAAGVAAQRSLADVLIRPPLDNVDLLDWQSFDRAIAAGYAFASDMLATLPALPRLAVASTPPRRTNSLAGEIERRLKVAGAA